MKSCQRFLRLSTFFFMTVGPDVLITTLPKWFKRMRDDREEV